MEKVISCQRLTKDYGSGHGLFNANIEIAAGEVFGLIGPNGAGKSTLIKLLMDLVRPTSGTARIFGLDAHKKSSEIKKHIGYLPGELLQFPGVTAGYILKLLLNMRGVKDDTQLNLLAARLKLDLGKKYQNLSHGNKQKVGLVQAFMHQPDLVILDEPTLGLDPMIQKELRLIIGEYQRRGSTIVLSSHVLSEVETVCSRVGLINGGQIIKTGSLQQLRGEKVHLVSVLLNLDDASKQSVAEALKVTGATAIEFDGPLIRFEVRGAIDKVLKQLAGYPVLELDSRELSLEEVFFSEVGS